jgi:hypothetical protein
MHTASLTWDEQERIAYITNDPKAAILGELVDRMAVEVPELFSVVEGHVDEAHAAYPDEDFADAVIADLQGLAERLGGDNRADLLRITDSLSEIVREQFLSTNHGREELSKIRMILGT